MDIKRGEKNFYIGDNENDPLAEMAFVRSSDKLIIIDHTYVSEELKGQGVGNKLLDALTEWARSEDKKIIPLCPFAKAQMEKDSKYHDLIY